MSRFPKKTFVDDRNLDIICSCKVLLSGKKHHSRFNVQGPAATSSFITDKDLAIMNFRISDCFYKCSLVKLIS
ncbi:hypothetical protein AVEN_136522-1 [Araneus ventricosus]|uniref:Uncharacterized protein n=1 Tax=Araneus ventricosus TaxID=182803 RepID=A0A4Y2KPF0_ARAVE|nr:hypothetical protein AVEN_136522-1 [Araneus ventricosus]